MTLLLDTHIFLWAVLEPQRLSSRVRELLENPDHALWISAVSAFEIHHQTVQSGCQFF